MKPSAWASTERPSMVALSSAAMAAGRVAFIRTAPLHPGRGRPGRRWCSCCPGAPGC
ncbi:MAG: hypothetical protein ACK559_26500 [bacterium]